MKFDGIRGTTYDSAHRSVAMVGKTFAHYVVLEKAGAGGMGVVFRARDETLHREVALKLPSSNTLTDTESRERVLREARAASALNHPHICTIYEVGEVDGQPYIAMEYLAGETLGRRIPPNGLPTESVLDLGAQVADAMDHAHTQGILHRDLKSANVRMTSSGQLKVLDFGLAMNIKDASFEGVTRSTSLDSGGVVGTLAYMAPELLQGKAPDVRTDIWSLGVLLYELAAGALPFQGRTGFELTTAILKESPAALPTHVTPGLRAVIMHCLTKDPENRYQHASEIRAALEALQSDTGVTQRAPAPPAEKFTARLVFSAASLLAIVALIFFLYGRFGKPAAGMQTGGKLRLFLSTEGNLSGPALSPDGKMLAYVQTNDGRQDLYVSRLAGGEHVRLTNDDSRKDSPEFSPDGEKIVFVRQFANASQSELCLIPALGGNVVPIASGAEDPTWSADGSRLAFILRKQAEPQALVTSAVDGSDMRVVLKGDDLYSNLAGPSWSPDDRLLAVQRGRGGINRDIWIVPAQGGEPTRLTNDAPGVVSGAPVFEPNGRGVIHSSTRGGASNLWWQPLGGKSPVQLTTGAGPDSSPSVARDGTIAFLNSRWRNTLLLQSLANGASTTLLTDSSRLWGPVFSPDGKDIAYSRDEPNGLWHLWIVPVGGGGARQLTSGNVPEIYPRFTPDGHAIFFNTWGAEPLSLGRVPTNGGLQKRALSLSSGSDAYGDVSPDGRSVVFVRTENKVSHLFIATTDGSGQARPLGNIAGTVPRWSPDGNWISFSPNRTVSSGVFIVHPDGSGLKRISEVGGWAVWWPDTDQLGFQVIGPDGNETIKVFRLTTGETRTLPNVHFVGSNHPFDISRDGKWLITTNYQHISDEIWLLEPADKK
jgi:serine/threonine protein kinase/Tol biopolymer transport system component